MEKSSKTIKTINKLSFGVGIIMVAFSVLILLFSYFWTDYGLILMLTHTRPFLDQLNTLANFGNTHREVLAWTYFLLIAGMFGMQILIFLPKLLARLSAKILFVTAGITTFLFSLAYPFLSYDIFTYLFSAKTVWVYQANPYLTAPESFASTDLWVSFMRNIQFTYPYGAVSLLYSLIPMIIFSGRRFILNFFGLKLMNAIVFYLAGLILFRLGSNKKVFSIWFFNPLLLIELLANSHNDLLMIGLFFLSLFYLRRKEIKKAWAALLASVFTKYVSIIGLPAVFLSEAKRRCFFRILSVGLVVLLGLQTNRPNQAWYYTWIYMFLPLIKLKTSSWGVIYLIGFLLLTHYFSFIRSGFWGGAKLIPNSQLLFYFLVILVVFIELDLWKMAVSKLGLIFKKS